MKQCVICGEDCSNKPRTKDRQGRYYCQACHDEAIARRKKVEQATTVADEPNVFDDILNVEAAPAAPPMGGGGGDASMGLEPAMAKAPPMVLTQPRQSSSGGGGRTWTLVIGILAITWGLIECGFHLLDVEVPTPAEMSGGSAESVPGAPPPRMMVENEESDAYKAGQQIGTYLGVAYSSLLLFGGIGCLMGKTIGPKLIRIWAWIRIFIICIAMMFVVGVVAKATGAGGGGLAFLLAAVFTIIVCVPSIVALVLLRTRGFKREMEAW